MITKRQFNTLEDLFNYYNRELFNSELPDCLVNLSRKKNSAGFFAPNRWKDGITEKEVHEISLNPDTMSRSDQYWHSTLVHEMVHLWQQVFGKPPRRCWHDMQWANKMIAVGLMPSSTGQPGGKIVGQSMSDYVIEGGLFDAAFSKITVEDRESLRLPYKPNLPIYINPVHIPGNSSEGEGGEEGAGAGEVKTTRSGVKVTYLCTCGCKVWGKPDLKIRCIQCNEDFQPQEKNKE